MSADLDLLIEAARGAAEIARGHWRDDPETWHKADASPVTEADLAVDRFLRAHLQAARPGYGWLSEETPDVPAQRSGETTFIVDPIDGTRAFAAGEPTWAHALAVAHRGEITAGVVYLPLRDKLYAAEKGAGATLNGAPIRVSATARAEGASLLASRPVFDARHWKGGTPGFARAFRPALAYRMALVAEGRYDALLTLRPAWEWDIAAGSLLVTEAGGRATPPAGARPHGFNSATRQAPGYLAANPALHAAIAARLA